MTPCPNCGNSEYDKKYICGKSYEDADKNKTIYCSKCVKDRNPKKETILNRLGITRNAN